MPDHLGVHQAARQTGLTTTKLYVAALQRRIPSQLSPGGKVLFAIADLQAFRTEETLRKVRRDREKTEAAERVRQIMAKRRAARKP